MKVYISCDIEGVAGITHSDETKRDHKDFTRFAEQMSQEAAAACRGALAAGAEEIWVKDAHGSGRNLIPDLLPKEVRLIRGWSGHPYSMMQELNSSFGAVFMLGYHSMAQASGNPLAHTISSATYWSITLNGSLASEFVLNACVAALEKVPVALVTGDEGVCNQAKEYNSHITTVPVNQGVGLSTISLHPELALERIEQAAQDSLQEYLPRCLTPLPVHFELKISFRHHADAYRASFFPGIRQIGAHEVALETRDYFDVMRALKFLV